ncbi:hypothetical protein EMIHUDRAFT_240168 [Emiliania huxleyi CCMP1516]|uniref:Uncharacterized protein n=2 Tax=Emiliania huxleyi TaxID=2903 RepID=A0A0D3JGE1_EMIH1|nr:hypothetical protein EMIHUDRAFT_240168 [Emiliania huxleyi CCMP1516]EOD22576.1 hypothetical protein EMIHUDRAFT_240168 [Emiliania huxleyi CCMP1516]|eukprot:XP_005775005.1 hypothetical protein EMIHUDRAFT_240168 [Emiliania huxleyi CCMP1516]
MVTILSFITFAHATDPSTTVTNQDAIDAAKTAQKDWDERNMKLYGLIIQAMPAWLEYKNLIFNSHKGKASLRLIGNCAFAGCSALTAATLPDSLTSIGKCSFHPPSYNAVTLPDFPDSLTSIGDADHQSSAV